MPKVKVPLHQAPRSFALIDTEATKGATIGVNVYNGDGTLYVPAVATAPTAPGVSVSLWRLILEIPPNVQQVAALASSGFVRRDGSGNWTAAAIAYSELPEAGASAGQALVFDGTDWAPGTVSGSGYPEGVAFPGSPSTDDKFYRTDRNILYYYDGTRWLSVQVYEMGMGGVTMLGATTTNGTRAQWPVRSDYGIYLERWNITTLVATTNNGSNFWTIAMGWTTAAGATTNLASFSTGTTPDAPTTWVQHDQNIAGVLDSTARALFISATRTGTGGALHTPTTLLYRLIG